MEQRPEFSPLDEATIHEMDDLFEIDGLWMEEMSEVLLGEYPGQFVAVLDQEVIGAGPQLAEMLKELKENNISLLRVRIKFFTHNPGKLLLSEQADSGLTLDDVYEIMDKANDPTTPLNQLPKLIRVNPDGKEKVLTDRGIEATRFANGGPFWEDIIADPDWRWLADEPDLYTGEEGEPV